MAFGSTPVDSNNIPVSCAYLPGTGFKAIRGVLLSTDGSSNDSVAIVTTPVDGYKTTYVASGTVVPVTGATDLVTIIGSASKTVKVTRIIFSGTITTAAINGSVSIVKRSTADTAGTSSAPALNALDSTNSVATAVVAAYTANPTLGTIVGALYTAKYIYPIAASGSPEKLVIDFDKGMAQAATLRGVAQQLAINLNAVAFATAGSVDYTLVFTEE